MYHNENERTLTLWNYECTMKTNTDITSLYNENEHCYYEFTMKINTDTNLQWKWTLILRIYNENEHWYCRFAMKQTLILRNYEFAMKTNTDIVNLQWKQTLILWIFNKSEHLYETYE